MKTHTFKVLATFNLDTKTPDTKEISVPRFFKDTKGVYYALLDKNPDPQCPRNLTIYRNPTFKSVWSFNSYSFLPSNEEFTMISFHDFRLLMNQLFTDHLIHLDELYMESLFPSEPELTEEQINQINQINRTISPEPLNIQSL